MLLAIGPGISPTSYVVRLRRLVWLAANALVLGGVLCCGGNGNSGAPPTLAVTPGNIALVAGAASQSVSLLLTAPASSGAATVTVSNLPSGVTIAPSSLSL